MRGFILTSSKKRKELSKEDYAAVFANLVMFMGTVPATPNALRGSQEPDEMKFYGGFDKVSCVLKALGEEYGLPDYQKAADEFSKGSRIMEQMKEIIVSYLTGNKDEMRLLPDLFEQIKEIMIRGYSYL